MSSESVESMNQLLTLCSRNDWEFMPEISESVLQRLLSHSVVWIVIGLTLLDENNLIDTLQDNQIQIEIITEVILVLSIIYQQTQTKDTNCQTQMRDGWINDNYKIFYFYCLIHCILTKVLQLIQNLVIVNKQQQSYIYNVIKNLFLLLNRKQEEKNNKPQQTAATYISNTDN